MYDYILNDNILLIFFIIPRIITWATYIIRFS